MASPPAWCGSRAPECSWWWWAGLSQGGTAVPSAGHLRGPRPSTLCGVSPGGWPWPEGLCHSKGGREATDAWLCCPTPLLSTTEDPWAFSICTALPRYPLMLTWARLWPEGAPSSPMCPAVACQPLLADTGGDPGSPHPSCTPDPLRPLGGNTQKWRYEVCVLIRTGSHCCFFFF